MKIINAKFREAIRISGKVSHYYEEEASKCGATFESGVVLIPQGKIIRIIPINNVIELTVEAPSERERDTQSVPRTRTSKQE